MAAWRTRRGAGFLRVDFPFRAYVTRLEQPHCLRNMRVSGARSKHTATAAPRQNRSEADFSAAVTQQTRSTSATQTVCPKASVENGRC